MILLRHGESYFDFRHGARTGFGPIGETEA